MPVLYVNPDAWPDTPRRAPAVQQVLIVVDAGPPDPSAHCLWCKRPGLLTRRLVLDGNPIDVCFRCARRLEHGTHSARRRREPSNPNHQPDPPDAPRGPGETGLFAVLAGGLP